MSIGTQQCFVPNRKPSKQYVGSDFGNLHIWDSVDFSTRVLRAVTIFSPDLTPWVPCEGPDKAFFDKTHLSLSNSFVCEIVKFTEITEIIGITKLTDIIKIPEITEITEH